jgi:hypothetical protein
MFEEERYFSAPRSARRGGEFQGFDLRWGAATITSISIAWVAGASQVAWGVINLKTAIEARRGEVVTEAGRLAGVQ